MRNRYQMRGKHYWTFACRAVGLTLARGMVCLLEGGAMRSSFTTIRIGCIVLIAVATGLFAGPVSAQTPRATEESSQNLQEVIVTAQRREENVVQVPISLTVFDQQSIQQNNLANVLDYAQRSPNVTVIDFGTSQQNQIAMRGISNQSGSLDQPFTMYVDEFAVQGIITNPQLDDVQRIEVLRGPQGTFFGRNSEAGAINITTNKPGRHRAEDS